MFNVSFMCSYNNDESITDAFSRWSGMPLTPCPSRCTTAPLRWPTVASPPHWRHWCLGSFRNHVDQVRNPFFGPIYRPIGFWFSVWRSFARLFPVFSVDCTNLSVFGFSGFRLTFGFRVFGLLSVYFRFTFGLLSVYFRFTFGLLSVHFRFTFGSFRSTFGSQRCISR